MGSSYSVWKFLPTCTEMGFTTYTCEDCGDSYISDYTDKLPHEYKATVTEPACTELGFTTYVCDDCGDSYIIYGRKTKL